MRMVATVYHLVAVSTLILPIGVSNPAVQGIDEQLLDDIEFARELARNGLADFATQVLDDLESEHNDHADTVALRYAHASVLHITSGMTTIPDEHKRLLEKAIDHYQTYLSLSSEKDPHSQVAPQELAEAHAALGKLLRTEADLARKEALRSFHAAIALAAEEGDLYRRGLYIYDLALVHPPQSAEREEALLDALDTLDEYIFETEQMSLTMSYAYFYQGVINFELALGRASAGSHLKWAVAALRFTLEGGHWGLWTVLELNEDLAPKLKKEMTELAERTTDLLAEIQIERFRWSTAIEVVDTLEENRQRFDLGSPGTYGYLAQLLKARALFELDDIDEALRIARSVEKANAGNAVGREARQLLLEWDH